MRRVQADDISAFDELYDRFRAEALLLARGICRGTQRADDAIQEGFLTIWRCRGSYDPSRGSARAWLMTVVRRRSIDVMRRGGRDDSQRAPESELDDVHAPGSLAEDAERRAAGDAVRASLEGLPERQREVIVLAYFSGLSHTEIAALLQLPAGTVKGRMRLGISKIRAELHPAPRPGAVGSWVMATRHPQHRSSPPIHSISTAERQDGRGQADGSAHSDLVELELRDEPVELAGAVRQFQGR